MNFVKVILSVFVMAFSFMTIAFASPSSPAAFHSVSPIVIPKDSSKINLNQATEKDLLKIKELSSSNRKAILSFHKKHGDFKSLDDLKKIGSFKKMKATHLKAIEDQLTI